MKQYLESIFKLGYTQYKGQGTGNGTDVQKSIRELTNNIRQIASKSGFQTEFSVGIDVGLQYLGFVFFIQIFPQARKMVFTLFIYLTHLDSLRL